MENKVNVCGVANKGVLNALKHRLEVRTCRCHITVEAVDPLEVTRNDREWFKVTGSATKLKSFELRFVKKLKSGIGRAWMA